METSLLRKRTNNGNRLKSVEDSVTTPMMYSGAFDFKDGTTIATEYVYDDCGAITQDRNKRIALIDYDFNGMPTRIQFKNGNVTEYTYSAEGVKLKTIHRTAVSGLNIANGSQHILTQSETLSVYSTLYVGNFEIDGNYCSKYYFANGYIDMGNTGSGTYHYTITDHLGNVRAVVDENGTLKQVNNYFAYGGLLNDVTTGADVQTHKYNGKELDRMHGLDTYDYGARNYDAALGQFTTMDPLCEKYYHISPYAYCGGNPVNRVDPDGRTVVADSLAQQNIINTLTEEETKYVRFNKDGVLNAKRLNRSKSTSENMTALKALSNSDVNYFFNVSEEYDSTYDFKEPDENGNYRYGVTLIPGATEDPSFDNDVHIYTASFLSREMQVSNTAHEGYGHAYFYELSNQGKGVVPFHTYDPVVYMENGEIIIGKKPSNLLLEKQIKVVTNQARMNYARRYKK